MSEYVTQLQRVRAEMRLSQMQVIAAMKRNAPGLGIHLPDTESLKTYLTRWENGRNEPGPDYRRLLRVVYGMTDAELGFPPTDTPDVAVAVPGTDLSTEGLAYFETLLGEHVRADNRLGPQHVIGLVEHQAHQLNIAARNARGPARRGVIALAFRYREFLGWLQQDSGRYAAAMESTDRALDMATELGDPLWNAYLLMRKSNIATDADDPASGAALADAALRAASGAPPKLHAVILRQKANAHAALGDPRECATAVDRSFGDARSRRVRVGSHRWLLHRAVRRNGSRQLLDGATTPEACTSCFRASRRGMAGCTSSRQGPVSVATGHRSRTSRRRRQGMQRGERRRSAWRT